MEETPVYKAEDPVYWGSDPALVVEALGNDRYSIAVDGDDQPREVDGEELELAVYAPLERFAQEGDKPLYSPFGYLINTEGRIFTLTQQYSHGIVLAFLHPEAVANAKMRMPDREANEYHWQRFELDWGPELPAIRIALSRLGSDAYISWGRHHKPNEVQITALRRCLDEAGIAPNENVQTEIGNLSRRELFKQLENEQ